MVKFNGKPFLRIKIRLRVIVWWPFCDFFFINRIPAFVKLTSAKRGGHEFFFPILWKRHENIKIITFRVGTVQSGDLPLFACYGHRAPKVTQIPPKTPFCPLGGPFLAHHGPKWCFFLSEQGLQLMSSSLPCSISIAIYFQSLAPSQTAPYQYQEIDRL